VPGFTKNQLQEAGANIGDYIWCRRCRLYWRRRGTRTHRHAGAGVREQRPQPPCELTPEAKELLDYLVDEEIKAWLAEIGQM